MLHHLHTWNVFWELFISITETKESELYFLVVPNSTHWLFLLALPQISSPEAKALLWSIITCVFHRINSLPQIESVVGCHLLIHSRSSLVGAVESYFRTSLITDLRVSLSSRFTEKHCNSTLSWALSFRQSLAKIHDVWSRWQRR